MYYGWRIAAACFTILFVIVGIVYYSFPVFYAPLIAEFGWSRAQATAGFFISMVIVGPVFGVSAGFLIDRHGARRVLLAGLVCAAGAFFGFSAMHTLAVYYLFYFMQAIGYVSAGPIPNQVLISQWFYRMRGIAMGTAYLGIGVGGAAAPVLAQFVIRHWGWRVAMFSIGMTIVLLLIPMTLIVVRNRPSDMGLHPDGNREPPADLGAGGGEISLRRALRTLNFWLILVGSLMSIGAVGGVIQHLQLHLRDQRFTPEHAAQVASLLLISSIAGRVTMGYLADRHSKKYVMLAAFGMVAAAIPFLYFVHVPGAVHIFAAVFGFGMGADYMLIPLMTAECFGVASLGRLLGIILTTDALSQALTPVLVGRIYDLRKSYGPGFAMLMIMAAIGAVAVMLISKKVEPQRDRTAETAAA